jgi:hypothetical protein
MSSFIDILVMNHGGCFLLSTLALIGCATARPVRTYVVSSEASSYSPVVHLAIAVDTTADSILVAIDSGSILAHGIARADGAVMRDLTLEAIVARKPETKESSSQLIEPWAALATSRPLRLVDSLVFEVTVPLSPLRLAVSRPTGLDLHESWLVFRIRGTAVTNQIRLADGRVIPGEVRPGGVRVYACSNRNLAGTFNKDRARRLTKEYASVC